MMPTMYDDLAPWWPLLSPVEEYVEEAALYREALLEFAPGAPPVTLLELGSGGGNNACHLKRHFAMTLVDLSSAMLAESRRLNPELIHHVGDMRTIRLGEEFDAVFIHDAIAYMTSREELAQAVATAFVHCRSGGLALFTPDETRERFEPGTSCGGSDDGARGFRYMEWTWDPDPTDETIVTDYAFLIRDQSGEVRVVHDRHRHGLFPRDVWLETIRAAGFEPHSRVYQHSELPHGYEFFIGVKR